MRDIYEIPHKIMRTARKVGFEESLSNRSGSYIQLDNEIVVAELNKFFKGKARIEDIRKAAERYSWLKKHMWKLIDPNKDIYTKKVDEETTGGYFIEIGKNQKITLPFQACLMISKGDTEQRIHNVIVAEEASTAEVITGCTLHPQVSKAAHIGITEFYIKKKASLNFIMIHNWNENSVVMPRSAALVDEGGVFTSNYVLLSPVKKLQTFPIAYLNGEDSRSTFNNVAHISGESNVDVGSGLMLQNRFARGEIISRTVALKGAKIIVRGIMEAKAPQTKAHLECRGLILDNESEIHAIPELSAKNKSVELTHEASVGKIAEKEIIYLMSRGLSEEEAISVIVRGFLWGGLKNLPEDLRREIYGLVKKTSKAY